MTDAVYVPKGWKWDRDIQPHERRTILERVMQIPDWMAGQLEAANLNVKAVAGHPGFFRLRIGNFRAVFQRLSGNAVIHVIDKRADVYEGQAFEGLRLVRSGNGLRVLARRREEGADQPSSRRGPVSQPARREEVQNPLSPFTNAQLREAGLDDTAIEALRRVPPELSPDEALAAQGMADELCAMLAELWERPAHYLKLLDGGACLSPALTEIGEDEAARRLGADDSATSLVAVPDADAFEALLDRPIEDWMVYLHPAQLRPVNLSDDGPVRVRGGAGTGKTVVALHRARRLAQREGSRVLLTTFVTTLPKVWEGLFSTFAPGVRERIDMRTVDSLALEIYREGAGTAAPAEPTWLQALTRSLHEEASGRLAGLSSMGLQDEFDFVLTGRSVPTLDAYLGLPRTGRGSALPGPARETVWGLYQRYLAALEKEERFDWHLLRAWALGMLREGAVHRSYDAVVVDEAQDLTEASIRLLVEVAGGLPRPRLTVVGDGQQSIYPGGFSLRSLGVDVRGRSTVLRTNWRNTYGIWVAANAFIAGEAFDDLEDDDATLREGDETPYPLRDGQAPRLHLLDGAAQGEEAEWLAELIADDLANGADPGDCAALVPTNSGVRPLETALRGLGVPTAPLTSYEGTHRPRVWVGTFHRAKGLEFKHLYVAGLAAGRWPPGLKGLDESARAESRARQLRAAFVALTRARDHLDVIVAGQPAHELEAGAWAFDR